MGRPCLGHYWVLSVPLESYPGFVLEKAQSREGWGCPETMSLPHHPYSVVAPHAGK